MNPAHMHTNFVSDNIVVFKSGMDIIKLGIASIVHGLFTFISQSISTSVEHLK